MKKQTKRIITLLLLLVFAAALTGGANAQTAKAALRDPNGPIIGISNKGMWTAYPENTIAGAAAAAEAGLEYVLLDVSLTRDGVPVLMAEDAAQRMLGLETPHVGDYTLEELSAKPLKNRVGGPGNKVTEYRADTLEALLAEAAGKGFTPVLKFDVSALNAVRAAVDKAGAGADTVLYLTGKDKAVNEAVRTLGASYAVIAEKRSNIIFTVNGFIDDMEEAGAVGAVLKTTNRYGVIFYKSTLRRCDRVRAVSDVSDSETAGHREDTVKWWDDLISRGYSVIVTDDPQGFAAYLADNDDARARLQALYTEVSAADIPKFGSALSDYKKAYTDAVNEAERLLGDASASTQEMRDCRAALAAAFRDVQLHYDEIAQGTDGMTVTLPRILLCLGAAAAVIAAQVFVYKKRKQK